MESLYGKWLFVMSFLLIPIQVFGNGLFTGGFWQQQQNSLPPPVTYATWNPSDKGSAVTLSNGNLSISAGLGSVRATISLTTGKWYWECTATSATTNMVIGVATSVAATSEYTGYNSNSWGYYGGGKVLYTAGFIGTQSAYVNGDVIGVAVDMGARTVQFYRNGVATGTALAGMPSPLYPSSGSGAAGTTMTCNFGATAFSYSPPAGYNSGVYQ